MAKDTGKNTVKNNSNDKNGNSKNNLDAATAAADRKAKRNKMLIQLAAVIVLVGVSIGATLVLVKYFAEPVQVVVSEDGSDGQLTDAKKPAIYYPMQPVFVVNFESQGRQRFLQAELNLLLREQDVIPVLELHMPAIRNSLVMLFSGQIYEDLQTAEGKELLRQQALVSVQDVLQKEMGKPGVEQVLFTNFVMQ